MPVFNVNKNFIRLLKTEDTDGDKKITVDDKGPKRFNLISIDGKSFEVCGTFNLSILLQELYLAKQKCREKIDITKEMILQLPVERVSSVIKNYFWDGLTRRIDESNISASLTDSKTQSRKTYLYIPAQDEFAFKYFNKIGLEHKELNLSVKKLPLIITDKYLQILNKKPGLLVLALKKNFKGKTEGVPFVVPGGRFNEMYGWDSYFESLGLINDGRIDLAVSMAENFFYQIEHYGKILNANRTYYLNRSQPPFLTSLIREIWRKTSRKNKSWLRNALQYSIKEYQNVWMAKDRLTNTGLSRYFGSGSGMPPETEPEHFDSVLKPFAKKYKMTTSQFREKYLNYEINVPELEDYFLHDRAIRESGHDTSYRLDNVCAHLNTVDLNSLLFKYEIDIAFFIKQEFNDRFNFEGKTYKSSEWLSKANKRKSLMDKLMWDNQKGLFFDYNFIRKKKLNFESATTFYPLWSGLASKKQAKILVHNALPLLEEAGGIAASTKKSRGKISKDRPAKQWDYPNGWAPHQMMIWQGLQNYGYKDHAARLAYKWLYTILKNFVDYNGTIPEKYDVVSRTHKVFAEYGNVGTEFEYITQEGFGWMNASFQVGLNYLNEDLRKKLNKLIPPEWIF